MSTGVDETDGRAREARIVAAILFVCLLLLAVSWPLPVVLLNELTFDAPLGLHEKSFLGREAPSWDIVFWAIAGLYALALIHLRMPDAYESLRCFRDDLRGTVRKSLAALREVRPGRSVVMVVAGAAVTAMVWVFIDRWLIPSGDGLRTGFARQIERYLNRLGGGMNPAMVVGFFALAGVTFSRARWWRYAIAMAAAGLGAGILVQVVKLFVSRARPELWLGPFFFAESTSSSFPSGHTAGAFALAGVLFFGSRSLALRLSAMALAIGIAVSRVIVFRHWPSDVVAGALVGLAFAWFFTRALVGRAED